MPVRQFPLAVGSTLPVYCQVCTQNGRNSFPANLSHLNFHPLEGVSRYRDPQHQVGDNYAIYLTLVLLKCFKLFFHLFKAGIANAISSFK